MFILIAMTYDGTSPEMETINNSFVMELVEEESSDLSDLLLPANEIKFIEIIGEGIPLIVFSLLIIIGACIIYYPLQEL